MARQVVQVTVLAHGARRVGVGGAEWLMAPVGWGSGSVLHDDLAQPLAATGIDLEEFRYGSTEWR